MNRAFLFVSVVLAVIAVIINQSYFDAPFPSDFKQGAYNLLLKAEEDIAEGNSETAIEKLKIAMMRANRCGRRGVFERIKTRFATSGRQIIEFDRQNALKMLCAYALFAADFNKTATQIESYVLNKTKGEITSFSYSLVYKNGSRTFWLESPKKAPIFLYRKLEPEAELYKYPGCLTFLKAGDLPSNGNFSYFYPISIGCPQGTRDFKIGVKSNEDKEFMLAVGTNDSNTFFYNTKNPYIIRKGENEPINIKYSKWYFVLNSIILFSDSLKTKNIEVYLIRDYKSL